MQDLPTILAENRKRLTKLFPVYDPIKGIGSPLERFEFKFKADNSVFLPVSMKDHPLFNLHGHETLEAYLIASGHNTPEVWQEFTEMYVKLRVAHDFEFWAATCAKIPNKVTKKSIPFVLRYGQRLLLKDLEEMRLANVPIREILLKARQWGGSTLIQNYYGWIQGFHKRNWHSAIIADVDDQARNIRGMYTRLAKEHPKEILSITFSPYEGSQKNRIINERGCIVGIGSAQRPDNFRSYDFSMVHMSEVGLFKETQGRKPEDLAQAMRASVPDVPYSAIILESTAKGVGNFFHREWQRAVEGKSGYKALFVSCFEIEIYVRKIEDYKAFIENMTEDDWYSWSLGATLEGIAWYNHKKESDNYDDWRMGSEFPRTAEEAFQSTGKRAFRPSYVQNARKNCIKPIAIGDVSGDASSGKEALKNIKFDANARGMLKIYAFPDESNNLSDRYGIFVDIGGRHHLSDYSTIKVFDRLWMTDGGVPEVVAVWRGHADQDLIAWKAAQIGTWYHDALVAVETNSLRKDTKSSEGDHFLTILDEIADHYENLFMRTSVDQIKQGIPRLYGFHTNQKTKVMLVDTLNKALRDETYIERDLESCDEMDTYEEKPDGTYGAVEGAHDDLVIVTAGGVWLCTSYMPIPQEIVYKVAKPKYLTKSEANF